MLGQTIELLETTPIFRGLCRKQLSSILDGTAKAYFDAGDNLIAKNYKGDTAYLILTGTARCLDFPGTPAASEKIESGSLVAELAMLVETVHSLTVQAKVRVRALAFKRDVLKSVMRQDPAIAAKISDNLLVRLQSFIGDLRRLDHVLACIESSAPLVYGVQPPPEPQAAGFPHLPHLPLEPSWNRRR